MNIHPLFVHFPIGILTLYVLFEVCRFSFITKHRGYFELKAILVILGTIAAYVATTTGDMAEELASAGTNSIVSSGEMSLLQTHAFIAMSTAVVFSILAGSYLFEYLKKQHLLAKVTRISFLQTISTIIQKSSFVLAVLGMILITITGGLGAALVYGPDIDIAVRLIYDLMSPFIQ